MAPGEDHKGFEERRKNFATEHAEHTEKKGSVRNPEKRKNVEEG